MTDADATLKRIADALDRIAQPLPANADPMAHPAYLWQNGALVSARMFAPLPIDLMTGVDAQRDAILRNSHRLARGLPAHDVLLWGARGAGKSALVKSCVASLQANGEAIAVVEVPSDDLQGLSRLFDLIAEVPRAFILFIDDLGFADGREEPRLLRSMLEGGAEARPGNARLYVTANRRHIVNRDLAEQASPINPRDVIDDKLALADRFGLSLGFHVCDQPTYVAMVEAYARHFGLAVDPQAAVAWATQRGSRSGRVAWQYVVELAGEQGKPLDASL